MSDSGTVSAGDVLPDCEIRLRPDGTVEHGGYWLDPVRMQLVLGVDVTPWHEEAIRQASQARPEHDHGQQGSDEGQARILWAWTLTTTQPLPVMGVSMWLRPGPILLPDVAWMVRYDPDGLCPGCVSNTAIRAVATHDLLVSDRGRDMPATIFVVGRDHRVLAIVQAPCHGLLAAVWQSQIMRICSDEPEADLSTLVPPGFPRILCHVMGEPDVLLPLELDQYLVAEGWRESERLRRQRRRKQQRRRRPGA
jgi:hypothetical protein